MSKLSKYLARARKVADKWRAAEIRTTADAHVKLARIAMDMQREQAKKRAPCAQIIAEEAGTQKRYIQDLMALMDHAKETQINAWIKAGASMTALRWLGGSESRAQAAVAGEIDPVNAYSEYNAKNAKKLRQENKPSDGGRKFLGIPDKDTVINTVAGWISAAKKRRSQLDPTPHDIADWIEKGIIIGRDA